MTKAITNIELMLKERFEALGFTEVEDKFEEKTSYISFNRKPKSFKGFGTQTYRLVGGEELKDYCMIKGLNNVDTEVVVKVLEVSNEQQLYKLAPKVISSLNRYGKDFKFILLISSEKIPADHQFIERFGSMYHKILYPNMLTGGLLKDFDKLLASYITKSQGEAVLEVEVEQPVIAEPIVVVEEVKVDETPIEIQAQPVIIEQPVMVEQIVMAAVEPVIEVKAIIEEQPVIVVEPVKVVEEIKVVEPISEPKPKRKKKATS